MRAVDMFETLQESESHAVVAEVLDSLAAEDNAQIIEKQIISGGLAAWAMHTRQLFPKEADELIDAVRSFYSVKEQAETPKFDSIEHYLHHRRANCGAR
jgi:hypothetical protein